MVTIFSKLITGFSGVAERDNYGFCGDHIYSIEFFLQGFWLTNAYHMRDLREIELCFRTGYDRLFSLMRCSNYA